MWTKKVFSLRKNKLINILTSLLVFLLFSVSSYASHLFGGELFYTHVSGNTYTVTMILYGDCSGSALAFQGLTSASPQIEVYRNNIYLFDLSLFNQSFNGTNVSPVCPDEANNTTCTPGGIYPGVRRFLYSANITLPAPATGNWRFRSTGDFQNSTSAGRSNSITNIAGANSLMSLEATLNNQVGANSSPTYTAIPTPFFCINKPQEYNQGAIDPNGDSLSFALVPGLDATTTPSINVTYQFPFTAIAPLACAPGTYNFNNSNGQLSFYPNQAQNALVVGRVSEYRNGVLIGTSMREMTFVVLSTCNNTPPDGDVINPGNGTVSGNTFTTCKDNHTITFNINNTDLDGDNVNLEIQGAPAGAVLTVTGNNTPSPNVAFSWNIANVAPGTYTFYLNYTDDGCPLASKQTVAYTINIVPKPVFNVAIISPATCGGKAVFSITPVAINSAPYNFNALQGSTSVLSRNNINGTIIDSLPAGTYTFRLSNAAGCIKDTLIYIAPPSNITAAYSWVPPTCPSGSNASISVTASGTNPPFQYAINTGAYGSANTFTGLSAGSYVVKVRDQQGCIKDSTIVVTDPPSMVMALAVKKPVCSPVANGQITITGTTNGTSPYQYAIDNGAYAAGNTFTGLATGAHTLHVKDAANCIKDSTIILVDSLTMQLQVSVNPVLCFGTATGIVVLNPSGTTAPYSFALNNNGFGTGNTFTGLGTGSYVFHIRDQNLCTKDTTITVSQPAPLAFNLELHHVPCYGTTGGSVMVTAQGGTPSYTYSADGGSYQVSPLIHNLGAGSHTISLKDNNNCIKDTVITLTQPDSPVDFGEITLVMPTCEGFADGSITLSGQGGMAPYTYARSGDVYNSQNVYDALTENSYVFKIKDANNCSRDTIITITGFPHIFIDEVILKEPTCFGLENGSIRVSASGGLPAFSYQLEEMTAWGNSPNFNNRGAMEYTVLVRDQNQCVKDTVVTLGQPEELIVDTLSVGSDCNGFDDGGFINVLATGGIPPYGYVWLQEASNTTPSIRGLNNGSYTVKVTDANGCTDTSSINILYSQCCVPHIPNAFTPNADGKNDEYKVEYIADMQLIELSIFNRVGQRVFSSAQQSRTWDGTFDGKQADVGTYYYYLRILCGNRTRKELIYKGDISLIR